MIETIKTELEEELEFMEKEIQDIKDKLLNTNNKIDQSNLNKTLTDYCNGQKEIKNKLKIYE